jgi:hypothetical protein
MNKYSKALRQPPSDIKPKDTTKQIEILRKALRTIKEDEQRIPRKPGQPANSDKHSDLYTDENPKGTIHGLKFSTPDDAKASVSKIKSSGRSHAHKIQAAIAMEQRAKVMGKAGAAAVYRSFINSMKEDAPVNAVGGGQIAGLGVGPQGEPGIKRKKKVASFISFMRRKAPV